MTDFRFGFEDILRDVVTGFEGRVTGRYEFINGCRQYLLEAGIKESGDEPKAASFDEERLEVVVRVDPLRQPAPAKDDQPTPAKIPGGPHSSPKSARSTPSSRGVR